MGLGKELLDRMNQMPDPPWAVTAVLHGSPLVLQSVVAIPIQRQLPLKLVQEVGRNAVGLVDSSVGNQSTLVLEFVVGTVMPPGKRAAGNLIAVGHHALRLKRVPLSVVRVVGRMGVHRV